MERSRLEADLPDLNASFIDELMDLGNITGEWNGIGDSDIINQGREGDSTSDEEFNDVLNDSSCPEEEECNSNESDEDSNTSSGLNVDALGNGGLRTEEGENATDEVNEEEAIRFCMEEFENSQQGNISINELEPCVGMEFNSENDAYNFYNTYAKEMGFSTRKYRVERSKADKRVLSRLYVCSKQGEKWRNDKRRNGTNYIPRASKKTKCNAFMRIKSKGGKWVVDLLEKEHNHLLVDPRESFRLRSHQKMTEITMQLISRLHSSGITPSQIMRILKDFANGEQHVGVTEERCRNFFRSKRRQLVGVDCQQAINYLDKLRSLDAGFFYAIRMDDNQCLSGIFWVDSRAREQYKIFGDVVVFDTTYKKNKYKFPFAPFTGVNHHMQCTLFGCGLIADETKESFTWLFQTWLQAMHNIHPKAILTDEDPSILRAIREVFPFTIHRLCEWHLEKHRSSHMRPLYKTYPDLKAVFRSCIRDSQSPCEFKERWESMIHRFKLENHKWLRRHFKRHKYWLPCYFSDTFFAGMSTTQRGESMNNYFKGFFAPSTPISEFVKQYEEAVKRRREKEAKADVNCITSTPERHTDHPIEKQAAIVYTINVFKVFTKEWFACFGLQARQCEGDSQTKRYKVFSMDENREIDVRYVSDNQDTEISSCSCKMFEQQGILCRHILKLYVIMDRFHIPQHYILQRWMKSARYESSGCGFRDGTSTEFPQQPVWILHDIANRIATEGSLSQERFDVALKMLGECLDKVLNIRTTVNSFSGNLGRHPSNGIPLVHQCQCPHTIDPRRSSSTRGRPSLSRMRSARENCSRRAYRCSNCNGIGHNARACRQVHASTRVFDSHLMRESMEINLNDPPSSEWDHLIPHG